MPGKSSSFIAPVEPIRPRLKREEPSLEVEAPGTAPGSKTPMPNAVYHHSCEQHGLYTTNRNKREGRYETGRYETTVEILEIKNPF
jgi:hypothetical protein